MTNNIGSKYSFIPWLRRGLSRQISIEDTDTLATGSNEGRTKKRVHIQVASTFSLTPVKTKENQSRTQETRRETIEFALAGPGDVSAVQPGSILQVVPANGVKNFESNYFPFIEFFEEDLPWRYTPAKEFGNKLRPWLALLVCKKNEFVLNRNSNGTLFISLKISSNKEYQKIFPDPSETWKHAHVQFVNERLQSSQNLKSNVESLLNSNEDVAFSRLLSTRVLEDNTAYTALLIPAFETGRLSGLSLSFEEIPAQRSSWARSLDEQKTTRQRPFDFPVYYQWEFETSTGSFIDLVRKLKPVATETMSAALKVDVRNMGNGLNYSILQNKPQRKVIDVPVATTPIRFLSEPYPSRTDEQPIADVMKELLSKNPILIENREQTGKGQLNPVRFSEISPHPLRGVKEFLYEKLAKAGSSVLKIQTGEMDDPWIVPPLYGGKHIMATSLEESDNEDHAWFTELNLDVRYRSVAGLGKKVVQKNQEEFVHRAWEQVEMINDLNQRLREYLLKLQVNSSIYRSKFDLKPQEDSSISQLGFNEEYLKNLMLYLQPMKYAPIGNGLTLNNVLDQQGIPSAYVSSAFQQITSSKMLPDDVNTASLTQAIAKKGIYKVKKHQINDLITKKQIESVINYYLHSIDFLILLKYV